MQNNGLLIIPVSSARFGHLFCPSSGPQAVTQSSAPEDGQNNCPKHVEQTGIINKPLLLYLVVYIIYISFFLRLAKQSQFIPLQNVVYFVTLPFWFVKYSHFA